MDDPHNPAPGGGESSQRDPSKPFEPFEPFDPFTQHDPPAPVAPRTDPAADLREGRTNRPALKPPGKTGRIRLAGWLAGAAAIGLIGYSALGGGGGDGSATETPGVSKKALDSLKSLGLKERVGQLLMVGPDAATELSSTPPGAIFIGGEDWPGAGAGPKLVSSLAAPRRGIAPLIATDQEGGEFRSLTDLPPDRGQFELGSTGSADAVAKSATEAARALAGAGFDLNLSPVADVATLTGPGAGRAFGDDPGLVAELVYATVKACVAEGIMCAPSHFPGQGAASGDTADGPATVGQDPAGLAGRDLPAFTSAIGGGARALVVSLAFYAAYDPVTPAALSPTIATGLLRGKLGFKGVAISDDLSSGAISASEGAPDAAVAAITAGMDMVWITDPADAREAAAALLRAANQGRIPEDRLNAAAARVLDLKRSLDVPAG